MNFCSHCGSKELKFIIPKNDSYQRYVCSSCGIIHYQNPKVIVGGIVIFEDKILLCKRAIGPRLGLWNLPAGFLENGEKAEDGALREIYEESLVRAEIIKLHAVFSLPSVNQVYLHFLCKMEKAEFGVTNESSEVELLKPDDIPWDNIAFHSTTFAIEKFMETGFDYKGVHIGSFDGERLW